MFLIFLLVGFSYGLLAGYYGMGFLPAVIAQVALLVMTMYVGFHLLSSPVALLCGFPVMVVGMTIGYLLRCLHKR